MTYSLFDIKNKFDELKDFNFVAYSASDVADKFGVFELTAEDFSEPGLYSVVIGSRGELENFTLIERPLLDIPTPEEIADGDEDYLEMIEEFYDIEEDVEDPGVLIFSFNEEEYEVFILVGEEI